MKTLYESILDTDKVSVEKTGDITFFPDFAKCFVKVFGKIDRDIVNHDKRQGAPQRLGIIKVINWKWRDSIDNEFDKKLHEMINMLNKKYPKMRWDIDHDLVHIVQNVWKVQYTIHFKYQEYKFDWCVDVIEDSGKIKKVVVFYLHTRATKNKELLKIIDNNI